MRTQVAVGPSGPAITKSRCESLTDGRRPAQRAVGGSLRERAFGWAGRIFLGLPMSAWLLLDVSILIAGFAEGYSFFPPTGPAATPHVMLWQASLVFALALGSASLVFGLYERETLVSRSRILTRMLLTAATAVVVAYAVIYVVMYATVSRRVVCAAMCCFLITATLVRLAACWAIHKVPRGLIVVGPRALLESFEKAQANGSLHEYRLLGRVSAGGKPAGGEGDPQYLGTISEQIPHLERSGVTDIVVGAEAVADPRMMDWLVACLQRGCRVTNEAIFYEKATGQILVDEIAPSWFLFADLRVHCEKLAALKRVVDLLTAALGLCISAPLWPLIASAVKLGDGGPVFHTQDRVGHHGKVFELYKFRTMRPDAENGESVWSSPNDTRVTRVGRFLRKTRLDELPQLYNILIGQMSIVGPRPERPDFVLKLARKLPYYAERHLVKPGLTGWAQISFRYGASIEDAKRKLQFDLYYLKHMSFELDMMILFRTAGTFLRGAC